MSFPKLFIPGPTHVSDDVLEAFSTYQVGHRTPEFSDLCETVIKGIQKVLYTENRVFLASHAATGLWELGLRNAVTPNSKVLHAVNGAFSNKWSTVSDKCGFEFSTVENAIKYAKKNKINYEVVEPKIRKIIKKSYADNFTK